MAGIKTSIKGTKKTADQLKDIGKRIGDNTSDSLQKSVYILEHNIVKGAPVDTGRYRLGWRTIKITRFAYEIRNAVQYSPHLIFGTIHRGILHDVRGVVRYWRAHIYKKALSSVVKK